jgi:HAD superfamily hydrolase (TIGR01459 family)
VSEKVFFKVGDITAPFKGILLDAYGVFWAGGSAGLIPGAKEAMRNFVLTGKTVGILSNTTQRSQKEIDKVRDHGLLKGEHFHFYLTSGEIAKEMFAEHKKLPFSSSKKKFYLFGKPHPRFSSHKALFEGSIYTETNNPKEADFIYIAIPHIDGEDQTDPKVFEKDLKELKVLNIPMVCTNPDRFAHEGNPPRAVVRQGSIAALFKEVGGEVVYMGKPEALVFLKAMERFLPCEPHEVLMVGDTPETDIRGAKKVGMRTALITGTGIMADRIRDRGFSKAVKACLQEDLPDFFVERL